MSRQPDLIILTKCDLAVTSSSFPGTGGGQGGGSSIIAQEDPHPNPVPEYREREKVVTVSAVTGLNLDCLRDYLDRLAFGEPAAAGSGTLALNSRHVESVREARLALGRAAALGDDASPEVVALELREALDAMGRVLGSVSPDELLARIFSTFCIGK